MSVSVSVSVSVNVYNIRIIYDTYLIYMIIVHIGGRHIGNII